MARGGVLGGVSLPVLSPVIRRLWNARGWPLPFSHSSSEWNLVDYQGID